MQTVYLNANGRRNVSAAIDQAETQAAGQLARAVSLRQYLRDASPFPVLNGLIVYARMLGLSLTTADRLPPAGREAR